MKNITLEEVKFQARVLKIEKGLEYDEALEKIAKENEFSGADELLEKLRNDFTGEQNPDEDRKLVAIKTKMFDENKSIKSYMNQMSKLANQIEKIETDASIEGKKEKIAQIEKEACEHAMQITRLLIGKDEHCRAIDTYEYCAEESGIAIYLNESELNNAEHKEDDEDGDHADIIVYLFPISVNINIVLRSLKESGGYRKDEFDIQVP